MAKIFRSLWTFEISSTWYFAIFLKSISYSRKSSPLDGHCTAANLHFIYCNKKKNRAPKVCSKKKIQIVIFYFVATMMRIAHIYILTKSIPKSSRNSSWCAPLRTCGENSREGNRAQCKREKEMEKPRTPVKLRAHARATIRSATDRLSRAGRKSLENSHRYIAFSLSLSRAVCIRV